MENFTRSIKLLTVKTSTHELKEKENEPLVTKNLRFSDGKVATKILDLRLENPCFSSSKWINPSGYLGDSRGVS